MIKKITKYVRRDRYAKTIPFFIFLIVSAGLLYTGCDGSNTNSLSSNEKDLSSDISEAADISDESVEDDKGLPDLYSNLKATPLSNSVNPVHLDGHNTYLPYPSDVFAYRDEASPTGVRLKITNDQFVSQIKKIPDSLQPDNLYKEPDGSDADGFSIATNVLFEFDREIDPDWCRNEDDYMARDGGDTFYLMDLTTGEFIPALVMESHFAKDRHRASRDYVMQVMAKKRFEYGRRYMAFVTKNFKDKDGNDFSCSTGFTKAKSQDGSDISNFFEPYLQYLELDKDIRRDDILAATIFTTRSRESSVGPLTDMFKTVLKDEFTEDHVKIMGNYYFPFLYLSRVIYGKMLYRDFRDEEGVIDYKPGFKGYREEDSTNWVPFLLFIPQKSKSKPYPVNILGSGIGMSKELLIPWAVMNASLGVASICIDWPSHGERGTREGWTVLEGIGWIPGSIKKNAEEMPRLLSMFTHISIDYMSTYRALKTYFSNSDKKGIKDLDTDNLSCLGISLGALCGTSAAASMPDLNGAFFHVASTNFTKVLSCGTFLLGGPSMTMPEGISGAWYAAAMNSIVSQEGDLFDGIHYADGFRNGVPEMGTGPRPLTITYGKNDGWVTAEAGLTFAELAELPLIYTQDPVNSPKDFIDNFTGMDVVNCLSDSNHYALIELSIANPENNLNQLINNNKIWELVNKVTGHNWYDIAGTLEHVLCGASLPGLYYQMNWMNDLQCNGNAGNLPIKKEEDIDRIFE